MKLARATLKVLRKRGAEDAKNAALPGADPSAWQERRISAFKHLLEHGEPHDPAYTQDNDLLPPDHPRATGVKHDPWTTLLSQEEQLAVLQKKAVGEVTRAEARAKETADLVKLHAQLAKLHSLHFEGNFLTESATGLNRADLMGAVAVVHDELERRGAIKADTDHPLYREGLEHRNAFRNPTRTVAKLRLGDQGVVLDFGSEAYELKTFRETTAKLSASAVGDLRASHWHPNGSRWHHPITEPEAVEYAASRTFKGADLGELAVEPGAHTEGFREFFVTENAALNGILVFTAKHATLRAHRLPFVLTEEAVAKGWMPPEGESALPASLEQDVPPEFRYWRAAPTEDPADIRKRLVRAAIFNEDNVQIVNGEFRRTLTKHFVVDGYDAEPHHYAALPPDELPLERVIKMVEAPNLSDGAAAAIRKGQLVLSEEWGEAFDEDAGGAFIFDAEMSPDPWLMAKRVATFGGDYVVLHPDTPAAREAMGELGRVFKLDDEPDLLAVTSLPIKRAAKGFTWVGREAPEPVPDEVVNPDEDIAEETRSVLKGDVRVVKAEETGGEGGEERIVYGIVLEPETVDSQGDIYSEGTIRKSAHRFMQDFRNTGFMHRALVNDQVKILESYIAPVDFEMEGQTVKKGTWLMSVRVLSDVLWDGVKKGQITGFSIGGSAIRTPAEDTDT